MVEFDKDDPDYIEQLNNRKLTEDTYIKNGYLKEAVLGKMMLNN